MRIYYAVVVIVLPWRLFCRCSGDGEAITHVDELQYKDNVAFVN